LAISLRFFSFFPYVIDHDESTYLVIADQLLDGNVYLKDVFDTKPIGIFWIYSVLLGISFNSIFFVRFFAAVMIGLSAALIYQISFKSSLNKVAAWASSLFYILLISTFIRWGMSPNTEIYFNFFALAAFYLCLFNPHYTKDLSAGILLGMAFNIKYVSLADAVALGLFLTYQGFLQKNRITNTIKRQLMLLTGFFIPMCFVISYFIYHSAWDSFSEVSFNMFGKYSTKISLTDQVQFVMDYLLRFFPISIFILLCFFNSESRTQRLFPLYLIWFILVLFIILIPGKYFEHYFIHLMPVSALIAGSYFNSRRGTQLWLSFIKTRWRLAFVIIMIALSTFHFTEFILKPDKTANLEIELSKILKANDDFYTGNANHILYFIFDKDSPTKYIHSSLLWNAQHRKALNINADLELKSILFNAPDYVLLSEPVSDPFLKNKLLTHYTFLKQLSKEVKLYKFVAPGK
jgi:hypothetical protein